MRRARIVIFLIALTLICGLASWPATPATVRAKEKVDKKDAIVVELAAGEDIKPIADKYCLKVVGKIKEDNSFLFAPLPGSDRNQLMALIAAEPGVLGVEDNATMASPVSALSQPVNFPGGDPFVIGTDPTFYQFQELRSFLQLDAVGAISQGQGVKVAVIDTGVDMSHPALAGRIAAGGYDFVDDDAIPQDEPGGSNYGHGTFIAGLVLLLAPQAQILPLRVMDPNGVGNAFDVGAAIRYAADNGAKVINLSLGENGKPPGQVVSAIVYAQKKGCIITAAMGNSNSGSGNVFPANQGYVLGIAATDFNDLKASFSNYGKQVNLDAPGVDLVSAFPGGLYARWSGTSFAAPLVSAESALLLAEKPRPAGDVIKIMIDTAVNIDSLQPSYHNLLGRGCISPLSALQH